MKYSIQQYTTALYETIAECKPDQHDKVIQNFIDILKKNDDLHYYEKIVEAYEKYDKEQKGEKDVTITTATETKVDKELITALNQIAGHKANIIQQTNPDIVGGMVIRVEDTLIDASAKTQLDQLNKQMKSEEGKK
ncbi:MAG: ATP synthase F1 subunit delta [Candidatus Doudnabacteria bacterium]